MATKRTVITNSDGTTSTITETQSGGGCSGCILVIAALVLITTPASFPLPLAILSYVILVPVLTLIVIQTIKGQK